MIKIIVHRQFKEIYHHSDIHLRSHGNYRNYMLKFSMYKVRVQEDHTMKIRYIGKFKYLPRYNRKDSYLHPRLIGGGCTDTLAL